MSKATRFSPLAGLFCLTLMFASPVWAADPPPEADPPCEPDRTPAPDVARADTYQGVPFQPGEEARYILKYGFARVHVGYGFLRVEAPIKQAINVFNKDGQINEESRWHRVLSADAYTGDWYKLIFAGKDKLRAISRPWDGSISNFYISQNEEKPFVRRYNAEKWLTYDHAHCKVAERSLDHKKNKEKTEEHYLDPNSIDAMGAAFKLRTFNYQLNKTERFMVYTSGKNWWLEATPIAEETITTAIGKHKAHKLSVKSYLGKDLQQKGKLFVWIASDHPQRPMLKIEGEVTFGSIYLEIDQFKAGTPLAGSTAATPAAAPAPAAPAVNPGTAPAATEVKKEAAPAPASDAKKETAPASAAPEKKTKAK